jgi:hypothetical protein
MNLYIATFRQLASNELTTLRFAGFKDDSVQQPAAYYASILRKYLGDRLHTVASTDGKHTYDNRGFRLTTPTAKPARHFTLRAHGTSRENPNVSLPPQRFDFLGTLDDPTKPPVVFAAHRYGDELKRFFAEQWLIIEAAHDRRDYAVYNSTGTQLRKWRIA